MAMTPPKIRWRVTAIDPGREKLPWCIPLGHAACVEDRALLVSEKTCIAKIRMWQGQTLLKIFYFPSAESYALYPPATCFWICLLKAAEAVVLASAMLRGGTLDQQKEAKAFVANEIAPLGKEVSDLLILRLKGTAKEKDDGTWVDLRQIMGLCGTGKGEFTCLIRYIIGRCEEARNRLQARGMFLRLYRFQDIGSPFKARNIGDVKMIKWNIETRIFTR